MGIRAARDPAVCRGTRRYGSQCAARPIAGGKGDKGTRGKGRDVPRGTLRFGEGRGNAPLAQGTEPGRAGPIGPEVRVLRVNTTTRGCAPTRAGTARLRPLCEGRCSLSELVV